MKTVGDYEYDEKDKLGKGVFGVVYKGHSKTKLDEVVAIKVVATGSCEEKELPNTIKREREILQVLSNTTLKNSVTLSNITHKNIVTLSNTTHKNIVTLFHYEQQANDVYFIMELCNGESLQEYLRIKKTLDERTISIFLKQIAAGLNFAHDMDIIHRDLKPENILLCFSGPKYPSPNDITLKIADFGIGRFLRSDEVARTHCGSPQYMAPEIYLQRPGGYDYKVDLWSVGVMAYQCHVGSLPNAFISLYGFQMPMNITSEFAELLKKLLEDDPNKRFTIKQFLNHPFLATTISVSVLGSGNEPKMMRVKDNQSVDRLIDTICLNYNINTEDAYLIHENRTLERGSGKSLIESGIVHNSTVSIVMRLSGGYEYDGQVATHTSPSVS